MANAPFDFSDQRALWNGPAGRAWIDGQRVLDRMFAGFEPILADEAAAAGSTVLDVGCGTGAVTLAAARRLGPNGRAVGIDISEPMIEVARERAAAAHGTAEFIAADAGTYAFAPGSFDAIISRFGVMFFDDLAAAFTNLRRAARANGRLRAVVWRGLTENPFMTTAERAAAPYLPELPPRRPDAPGQFALADADRARAVLADSRWADIDVVPLDVECTFPAAELDRYVTRLGPVGMFLHDADEAMRTRVAAIVRAAFDPFVHGDDVRFTAACWMLRARAGAR